jgi:FKBP-type peptidyl-prolyl cis-trans isomerase SlyD
MNIEKNKVALIHYTLKDESGEILDSSEGRDPLAFIQGIGNIIIGLEEKLEGKAVGDKIETVIGPDKAYGVRSEENVHKVPLASFQPDGDEKLEVGMQVRVETNQGVSLADVAAIEGEEVTLDLNHPLAGETLHFNVEVIDVRDATKEELDHGHAHGPGGHHH